MNKLTDEEIAKVIQYGGAIKGMPLMPSNPVLKGADLAAVVAYTRSLSNTTALPADYAGSFFAVRRPVMWSMWMR